MSSLSLTSDVRVFPCPNCRETINTSMQQCAFCATPLDLAAAEASAAETSRISQACSDASYLRILLGALGAFTLITFTFFLGLLGVIGAIFLKYAVPILCIRWWIRYGRIRTSDPDFPKARRTVIWVSALSTVILLIFRHHLFGLTL